MLPMVPIITNISSKDSTRLMSGNQTHFRCSLGGLVSMPNQAPTELISWSTGGREVTETERQPLRPRGPRFPPL